MLNKAELLFVSCTSILSEQCDVNMFCNSRVTMFYDAKKKRQTIFHSLERISLYNVCVYA